MTLKGQSKVIEFFMKFIRNKFRKSYMISQFPSIWTYMTFKYQMQVT